MTMSGRVIGTEGKKALYPSDNFMQRGFSMHIRDVVGATPNTVNTSVVRTRRYLTGREVEKLIEVARKHGRYGPALDAGAQVGHRGRNWAFNLAQMQRSGPQAAK